MKNNGYKPSSPATQLPKCPTGIWGLDEITGGGFDPDHHPARRKGKGGFGMLGMRERAGYVGGVLKVKSVRRAGTEIEIRIPLPPGVTAAN